MNNREQRKELKLTFAEDVLTRVLKKFRRDYGFTAVNKRYRNNGFNKNNPYNHKIWDVLTDSMIVVDNAATNYDDGKLTIVEDKKIRKEITSYLDNALLGSNLKKLLKILIYKPN